MIDSPRRSTFPRVGVSIENGECEGSVTALSQQVHGVFGRTADVPLGARAGLLVTVILSTFGFFSVLGLISLDSIPLAALLPVFSTVVVIALIERSRIALLIAWGASLFTLGAIPALAVAFFFVSPTLRLSRQFALVAAVVTTVIVATATRLSMVGEVDVARGSLIAATVLLGTIVPHLIREIQRSGSSSPGSHDIGAWLSSALHDGLGHRLALLNYRAQALVLRRQRRGKEFSRLDLALNGIVKSLDELVEELHRMIAIVARFVPGEASGEPTRSLSFHDLVDLARDAGADVTVAWQKRTMPAAIRSIADDVAREGLANALRHGAPAPIRITATMDEIEGSMVVVVRSRLHPYRAVTTSDGILRPRRLRSGLGRLQSRAEALGGAISTYAYNGDFVLVATLPSTAPRPYTAHAEVLAHQ